MATPELSIDDLPPVNRFKHQSYAQSLKEVHLPSAFNQTQFERDIGDNESHFHEALDHWRQLNLAPSFIKFANHVDPLSLSMPLLLHHWKDIIERWEEAMDLTNDEGLRALLDLMQKLAHDLRTTLSSVYPTILKRLLKLFLRPLDPAALTVLLETLSSLFRYLLVPSIHTELISHSWNAVRSTLPKCLPEIQRAVAEVWGSVLRRLKSASRDRAVSLLAENAKGLEDASAWSVVFACRSISQMLHTSTIPIYTTLITYHLSAESTEATYTVLRRSLTALVHHVKSAEQFLILGDLLVRELTKVANEQGTSNPEGLRRMLEIISIPYSVRQGSRMSNSHHTSVFTLLPSFSLHITSIHPALLKLTSALFLASDTSFWLGSALKFLQTIWSLPPSHTTATLVTSSPTLEFSLKLHAILADISWPGWKLIALPPLLKATRKLDALASHVGQPGLAVGFLAALVRAKKLSVEDVDFVWREGLERWVLSERLGKCFGRGNEDVNMAELDGILTLSPFMGEKFTTTLVEILDQRIHLTGDGDVQMQSDDDSTTINDRTKPANAARILGACMQALQKRAHSEWSTKVDICDWIQTGIKEWGTSPETLAGLTPLARTSAISSAPQSPIPLSEIYPHLRSSLISHSRTLRLNALRLMDMPAIISAPDGVREVLRRCLQGEEVPLDVQGVRERVLRIGRVVPIVGDPEGAEFCARWLVAQLKVNLRPLWSPAAAALASLSQRFGDVVWKLVFSELQQCGEGGTLGAVVVREPGQIDEGDGDDIWEGERTWRDPSAHKLRVALMKWLDPEYRIREIIRESRTGDRFDPLSYEHQLLATLGECHNLAEKHNRDLITYFLSLTSTNNVKLPKHKLTNWLMLFSKFSNPKALHATDTMGALYLTYLSHPDRSIQSLALSCLFTYKYPELASHEDQIRLLLDDTRWRDELTLLQIDAVDPEARQVVVDVTTRLLFGLMLEKKGRTRGADRRAAVLTALSGCTDTELGLLVDLMLKPFGSDKHASHEQEGRFAQEDILKEVTNKQIVGYLTLLGDVLKNLGSRLVQYWPALLGSTIAILHNAQKRIDALVREGVEDIVELEEADDAEDAEVKNDNPIATAASAKVDRNIRQLGIKRFTDFFKCSVSFDFSMYLPAAFTSFIAPRLPNLDKENTQAPSALMELFYAWSLRGEHSMFLVRYSSALLPKVYDCLIATNVKPSVIMRIFDITECILANSAVDETTRDLVLKPHVSKLLNNLALLVERVRDVEAIATPIGQRQIGILSEIAQYSEDATQATTLLTLFVPLLRKPAKFVSERVKVDLLKILAKMMDLIPELHDRENGSHIKIYQLFGQLFQSLRSRASRTSLVNAFNQLARLCSIETLASLLDDLNAYSTKRVDEPDFNRRLDAFARLNQALYLSLSPGDWMPILYNGLYCIQDPVELAIRNNASFSMRHFIDQVRARREADDGFDGVFLKVLFPGLKNGLRSKNELVRAEVLNVIAYAVGKLEFNMTLKEMRVLLEGGDEEANFFNNILHVQLHRRSRALRRLGDHCDQAHLRSSTIAEIFVPLVSNYITSTTTLDHHLVTDAITATGRMARHLNWPAYYSLVQRYIKLSKAKDESERVYVRAIVTLLDNFHFPIDEVVAEKKTNDGIEVEEDGEREEPDKERVPDAIHSAGQTSRIADAVNLRLLPSLLSYLEKHDPTTDDNTRIPVSIGIVTVAKHLPESTREPQITRLLTILSQILRSRSQETRDLARDAIVRISISIGPRYLPLVFKELRSALLRGPQLHVLAFTAHAILVQVTSQEHIQTFNLLDDCVNDVAHISAEVIFGESGKDVLSEDFKTKMREVRGSSSKGLDSFAMIARVISPNKISSLLAPLRAILQETESHKVTQPVDETLKRIASGLNNNQQLIPTELIVLCNTLINQNAKFLKQTRPRKEMLKGDAIVQLKRDIPEDGDHYTNNSFRFVVFGLDLFNTALRRSRFDFHDTETLKRLESMVVVVGNTLYSTNASVITLGLRCAAGLTKCPLRNLAKSVPVFIAQMVDIIHQTGNTESEVVQVTFKSLATILRDFPGAQVREKDLIFLLELLSPDLEEHERQVAVFTMLRAIVARKFVVPEIYDIMDKVGEIMVTSQSPQAQELCRGVLLQFLLDYPQGKGRLRNQMAFFAKNLSYVYESGRKSVMEILSAVITKFQDALIHEYADLLFVALVMVTANDDSAKCREMGAHLIKNLYARLDEERRKLVFSHLHAWAIQNAQPQLTWVSSQVYGFIVDAAQMDVQSYIGTIVDDLYAALAKSSGASLDKTDEAGMVIDLEWKIPYHALTVLLKIHRAFPDLYANDVAVSWELITTHLLYPHTWVRTAACRLLGLLFASLPVAPPRTDLPDDHPLSATGMQGVAKKLSEQLKSENVDETLGMQVVKNLFFIGKCFYAVPKPQLKEVDAGDRLANDLLDDEAVEKEGREAGGKDPLPWLFSKLSYQIKSAHIARRNRAKGTSMWHQQPLAALRWFAAMASHMDPERVEKFLVHILTPVYRLTEDDTVRDAQMEELKTTATELQDLVQAKVGTTKFSSIYTQIRQQTSELRRNRKVARALSLTTNPEAAAKRKLQRNMIKKESRKRKDRSFAESRGKFKKKKND